MPLKRKAVEKSLTRKGFHKEEGDHHYFRYYDQEGKKTSVFTKTSHGEKDLTDWHIAQMAKQLRLRKSDFLRLINCPLTRREYERGLREGGHIQ